VPYLRFQRAPTLIRPFVLACGTWCLVAFLYSLHLSSLLLFETREVVQTTLYICLPIVCVSLVPQLLQGASTKRANRDVLVESPPISLIETRVRQCLWGWVVLAIIETIVSGGIPIIWLMTGNSKTYFDYGIPSIHGMVNSLLLALAATSFALYLYTGKKRHLGVPAFAVVWMILLITRGTILFLLAECIFIYLRLRRVRIGSIIRLALLGGLFLVAFGIFGDLRSGAEAFRNLAQPTANFPDWAPSGFLWAYIYITTPINNLMYTMHTIHPLYNPLLPNSAATLFPSVIRFLIYGHQAANDATSGGLVVEALNVSTAYVGPYQDMGRFGIIGFSLISAAFCEVYFHKNGMRNILYFSMFSQTLVLSLFYNLLLSLPILGQLAWFYYFTYRRRRPLVLKSSGK
jgi:oligosaccharide repeat unit polymerase